MVKSAPDPQPTVATTASFEQWLGRLPGERNPAQQQKLRRAFALAKTAYGDAERMTGVTSMQYAQDVALLVAQLGLDGEAVMAGLLHGLPRQADFDGPQLDEQLGADVLPWSKPWRGWMLWTASAGRRHRTAARSWKPCAR